MRDNKTDTQIERLQWGIFMWVLLGPALLALALTVGIETKTSYYSGEYESLSGTGGVLLVLSFAFFVAGMIAFLTGLGGVIREHLGQQREIKLELRGQTEAAQTDMKRCVGTP